VLLVACSAAAKCCLSYSPSLRSSKFLHLSFFNTPCIYRSRGLQRTARRRTSTSARVSLGCRCWCRWWRSSPSRCRGCCMAPSLSRYAFVFVFVFVFVRATCVPCVPTYFTFAYLTQTSTGPCVYVYRNATLKTGRVTCLLQGT
jgi:hypothetical protein